jgi:hypothetical protein
MGSPGEGDYFYDQFRDYGPGDPRAKDVVYDPNKCNPRDTSPERRHELDEFFCRFAEALKKNVFLAKRPAFAEPPYFSVPNVKLAGVDVAAGATVAVLDRVIEDRQRAIVTSVGVDVNNPQAVSNGLMRFWFAFDGVVVPLFDDQTPALVPALQQGQTLAVPGTVAQPFNLLQTGVPLQVKGKTRLQFFVQNNDVADIHVCALITFYQYWLQNAAEFEAADNQV